ncbi:MAG: DUF1223 domain-containing protein [Pseudomonadota bacterium]
MALRSWAAAALVLLLPAASPADKPSRPPVVVELFTSQGCAACPAADKVLAELDGRADVLALSWAVDYWDYLGWPDSFAMRGNSLRQRAYNRSLGRQAVFTPQMVIDGRRQLVGSRRKDVLAAVAAQAAQSGDKLEVRIDNESGARMTVRISGAVTKGSAVVRMLWFDRQRNVAVQRGENRGRTLTYTNIVRGDHVIGRFEGGALTLDLPMGDAHAMECDGLAVIVQADPVGPVLGADAVTLFHREKAQD